MAGLRERKKQETRQRIVRAAEALFAAKGLQQPTVVEIAAAADVSVATLYNYFGSKLRIQLAVFEAEAADIAARGARVLDDPGDDPQQAVERLLEAYLDGFLAIDRGLLIDALSRGLGDTDLLPGLVNLDLLLLQQVGEVLAGFAARDRLSGDGIEDAALLLYGSMLTVLLLLLTVRGIDPGDVRRQLRRLVAVAFRGLGTPKAEER